MGAAPSKTEQDSGRTLQSDVPRRDSVNHPIVSYHLPLPEFLLLNYILPILPFLRHLTKDMAWTLGYLSLVGLAWLVSIIAYRLLFHPLSKVPGPKLAAITHLYKTYFNATGGSKFYIEIDKLHRKYGEHYRSNNLTSITDRT